MPRLFLFDVDGTIVESGQKITTEMADILCKIKEGGNEIGIVGGGKLEKVIEQMDNMVFFNHYFTECGCVYNKNVSAGSNELNLVEVYKKNIRNHPLYKDINVLVKHCLKFLSNVDYTLTGHFVDLRNGIIYVSLIGLTATPDERAYFMNLDKLHHYRENLMEELKYLSFNLGIFDKIDVVEGGSVGIAIYPSEYDKIQVLDYLNTDAYETIYYFGDKYDPNGNDYRILNDCRVKGFAVYNYHTTMKKLSDLI